MARDVDRAGRTTVVEAAFGLECALFAVVAESGCWAEVDASTRLRPNVWRRRCSLAPGDSGALRRWWPAPRVAGAGSGALALESVRNRLRGRDFQFGPHTAWLAGPVEEVWSGLMGWLRSGRDLLYLGTLWKSGAI